MQRPVSHSTRSEQRHRRNNCDNLGKTSGSMRRSLRRSCAACAKAKHSCDLRTPRCSRCARKNVGCSYTNEPLRRASITEQQQQQQQQQQHSPPSPQYLLAAKNHERIHSGGGAAAVGPLVGGGPRNGVFDPFEAYPPTRLPREHVQRLIRHFLSRIAFQYYPLEADMRSNPFVVSWWPLALADPALFHVSLQTASLDEERSARNGFPVSELLMADSVALVRRRVGDPALAFLDETMNSVITLAAIEHGKGNIEVSRMHIAGLKRMIGNRGGISQVRLTSPLTARMVSWVSLLVAQSPQFSTQDDRGVGEGLPPIPQWVEAPASLVDAQLADLEGYRLAPGVANVLARLRVVFSGGDDGHHHPEQQQLSTTELHDLTCFVIHRLLLLQPLLPDDATAAAAAAAAAGYDAAASEMARCAIVLYMFVIHGATYYTHHERVSAMVGELKASVTRHRQQQQRQDDCSSLLFWALCIGLVSSAGTAERAWFVEQAGRVLALLLQGQGGSSCQWEDVARRMEGVLWLRSAQHEEYFRQGWAEVLAVRDGV